MATFVAAVLFSASGHADDTPQQRPPAAGDSKRARDDATPAAPATGASWDRKDAERRGGFVVGFALGAGLGSIAGFPNDVKKAGYARYYTETGARPGSTGTLWLGGALTDWFVFGIGFGTSRLFATGDNTASAGGLLFHLEAFPTYPLGRKWRDVGVMFDFGTGSVSVAPSSNADKKLVDSGAASMIGGGVFYEGFRFWKISSGPFLQGNYFWSDTARRPGIFLGWRMSLYTSP